MLGSEIDFQKQQKVLILLMMIPCIIHSIKLLRYPLLSNRFRRDNVKSILPFNILQVRFPLQCFLQKVQQGGTTCLEVQSKQR
jgi:hypothetical protein